MSIAMIYPGQGSQSKGMQAELASRHTVVQETYAEASEVLGFDLWSVVQEGPEERLGETVVTQPAMLAAGVAAWRVWKEVGGAQPVSMAGHSLGEYTALTCAEAFSFSDALTVVKRRSELMQEAVPVGVGAMAAVLGLDDEAVLKVCEESSNIGVAEAVNFNSPGQVVIAGHKEAVQRAVQKAKEAGARRAILLPVSVPSHSSLMVAAGEALSESLMGIDVQTPKSPVINATDATPYTDAGDIRKRLSRQVYSPVQWVDTINALRQSGATSIVECGPGKVLTGLVRRIDRNIQAMALDTPSSLDHILGETG